MTDRRFLLYYKTRADVARKLQAILTQQTNVVLSPDSRAELTRLLIHAENISQPFGKADNSLKKAVKRMVELEIITKEEFSRMVRECDAPYGRGS